MIPKRIVVLGASSVHGRGDFEKGGFIQRLRVWHEAQHPQNFVYELGVFGESIEKLVARSTNEARARNPHLIVLYPGFNDLVRIGGLEAPCRVPLAQYQTSIEELLEKTQEITTTLFMTGFPFDQQKTAPFSDSNWHYMREDADRYIEVQRRVSASKGCLLLDYYKSWQHENLTQLLDADGLHANPAGHEKLFIELRDFLLAHYL